MRFALTPCLPMKLIYLLVTLTLCNCVTYSPLPGDANAVADELQQRTGGQFDWPAAVQTAFRQNARLQALTSRARAAGLNLNPSDTQSEYRSEGAMLALMADPVSLLNLGQRGASNATLKAEAAAAAEELSVARWEVARAIAEGFAVAKIYADLPELLPTPPAAEFLAAGLASPRSAQSVASAHQRQETERQRRKLLQESNLVQLRELLGLPAVASLAIADPTGLPPGKPDTKADLLQRPDLALATARLHVADAAFRQAVADQYPSLMLGPEFPLRGDPLQMMAIVRLPLGASGAARAAEATREALRCELAAAWLNADRETRTLELERDSTRLVAATASANAASSRQAYTAALIACEVEMDAFDRLADTMTMAVRDLVELREALEAAARADVRARFARGWPTEEAPR